MVKPALLTLALPLLLASCTPVASLLASMDNGEPAVRRVGPLAVGQSWTVGGRVDSREVSARVAIGDLRDVPEGTASVSLRDQIAAFEAAQAGFGVATYTNNPRTLTFRWVGEAPGLTYSCRIENLNSPALAGVLRFERDGRTAATGTCQAVAGQ